MIEARDFAALREVFREWPPADVAEVILDLPEDEQVIIFRVLPHDLAADVFEYIGIEEQDKLLRAMAHEQVVGRLSDASLLPQPRQSGCPRRAIASLVSLLRQEPCAIRHASSSIFRRSLLRHRIPVRETVHATVARPLG